MNSRKTTIREHFDRLDTRVEYWKQRNRYYHDDQNRYFAYLVEPGRRVLELGCGPGDLLAALKPKYGVGVDFSPAQIALARRKYPQLRFEVADAEDLAALPMESFDYIILSDLVGYLDDIQYCLEDLRRFCHANTRLIVSCHNFLWQPILVAGERLGLKMPTPEQSWISLDDLRNLLYLADFQIVKAERRLLLPKFVPVLSWLCNHLGALPGLNALCLSQYWWRAGRRGPNHGHCRPPS